MTKQTKPDAAVTTDVIEAVTATAPALAKAQSLHIVGAVPFALAEACVHIRNGMCFDESMPFELFGATGMLSFHLVRGTPDVRFVEIANESATAAVQKEAVQYERQIAEAAAQLLADREKAAAQAAIAAQIEAAEATVRALKRQAVKAAA